jgi:phage-related protein
VAPNFIALAKACLEAYQNKDLETTAGMITDDVTLQDWNVSGVGREFYLRETKKNFDNVSDIKIEVRQLLQNENSVAAQLKITLNGGEITLEVVDVFTFNGEGLITSVRAYKG